MSEGGRELARNLGPLKGAAVMLNIVLGAGLLILPGLAVRQAGDHALLAWGICALAALPLLAVFVILGRRFPDAGGIGHFAARAFGPAWAPASSFILLGAVAIGLPSIALTGGYYAAGAVGGSPHAWAAGLVTAGFAVNLLSAAGAARVNQAMAAVLLVLLGAIAVTGAVLVPEAATPLPLLPDQVDWGLALAPFMMIFFAFTGWEIASNLSEEFRDPARDFPRAMALSFVVAVVLYLVMAWIAQTRDLDGRFETPFAAIMDGRFGAVGGRAVAAVVTVMILANLAAAIWGVSRMIFALARAGTLPSALAGLRGDQPVRAAGVLVVVLLAVIAADAAGFSRVDVLLGIAGQNFLILYGVAAAALFRLSEGPGTRLLAAACVVLVAGLALAQGGSVIYPLVLAALGLAVQRRPAAMSKLRAAPPKADRSNRTR
ncbi:APC family permease [Tistrella mobilis]|uniref:Amino acid transporter n=1 Tax=Tistrella mobilis (strain KA081020-065) TaxID=1110502 RepID=I3TQR6_TISMK|nr:amino acid permease [Tistrella mobilis]AFK55104.1 amino acid transporter [Tistrella mobilis KA081020-065]